MVQRMRRVQIRVPEEEYRHLKGLAQEQQRSIGSLVREAVGKQYPRHSRQERIDAVRRIAAMRLPVADWPEMEREIMRGALLDE